MLENRLYYFFGLKVSNHFFTISKSLNVWVAKRQRLLSTVNGGVCVSVYTVSV